LACTNSRLEHELNSSHTYKIDVTWSGVDPEILLRFYIENEHLVGHPTQRVSRGLRIIASTECALVICYFRRSDRRLRWTITDTRGSFICQSGMRVMLFA